MCTDPPSGDSHISNNASTSRRFIYVTSRLKALGIVVAALGLVFLAGAGFAYLKVQEGSRSLASFSAAQNVELTYNKDGQLTDRGKTEGADAIMALLKNDWGYPVQSSEMNPNDPLVNTASEYMYQMATIAYHTLHGVQQVTLTKDVTDANGKVYKAGTYEFPIDGRYWSAFDRSNPIEAAAREQAWTGTAHALIAELGVGAATASALQLGLGLSGLFAGVGGSFIVFGVGLIWAAGKQPEEVAVREYKEATRPI
jgi:hypothetical protein